MKKIVLFVLFFQLLTGCNTKFTKEIHYFDEYDYMSQIKKKNTMILTINKLNPNEYMIVFEGDGFVDKYNEKIINGNNIYRKFEGEYIPYYLVDSIGYELKRSNIKKTHLSFPNVIFTGQKEYKITEKKYTVLRFTEYDNDIGMSSYYLEDFGFIAFDLSNGRYFLCTRSNNREDLNWVFNVSQKLVQDTSFFSIFQFMKTK